MLSDKHQERALPIVTKIYLQILYKNQAAYAHMHFVGEEIEWALPGLLCDSKGIFKTSNETDLQTKIVIP